MYRESVTPSSPGKKKKKNKKDQKKRVIFIGNKKAESGNDNKEVVDDERSKGRRKDVSIVSLGSEDADVGSDTERAKDVEAWAFGESIIVDTIDIEKRKGETELIEDSDEEDSEER